jgi:hypothetical protein
MRPIDDQWEILRWMKRERMPHTSVAKECGTSIDSLRAFLRGDVDHPDHDKVWRRMSDMGCPAKVLNWDDPVKRLEKAS